MNNFEFYSPTKVIFGKGVISGLGREASLYGKKALLVYGRNALKNSGLFNQIVDLLSEAGLEVVEHSGVEPNPILTHVLEGVGIARRAGVDMVIAAGGGSVIDEAKAIAAGTCAPEELWLYYEGKATLEEALPVIAVQTLPATSSETNQVSVVTNRKTEEKFGLRSRLLVPKAAFLDPETTYSIPLKYTAYACFDIMSHMLEGYFTTRADFVPVQEGFIEGLVKAVMISLDRILKDPEDYDARASVMWAGALAWNGLANAGLDEASIPGHMLEHPLSAIYNVSHGAGLTVMMPAWLKSRKPQLIPRILKFGKNILGLEGLSSVKDELEACDRVLLAFEEWISSIGCPLTLSELGIDSPDLKPLVSHALKLCSLWGIEGYTEDELNSIYSRCM